MNNDNKLVKFTTFVLLITIIALILVSGTYAKYTSTATGSDEATVAKWSILVGTDKAEMAGTTTKTLSFDIFSTITNEDGSEEKNVKATDGTLVAPGTMGSFEIALENASEVTAEYKTTYTIETNGIPLEFSTDKASWSTDINSISDTTFTQIASGASTTTQKIYWRWAFNGDDTTDTTLGATPVKATVTATIVAQQVN